MNYPSDPLPVNEIRKQQLLDGMPAKSTFVLVIKHDEGIRFETNLGNADAVSDLLWMALCGVRGMKALKNRCN